MNIEKIEGEEWKHFPIRGYPEYSVSNFGRVYSKAKKKGIIKLTEHHKGYFKAQVGHRGENRKGFFVHRLVAMAFIPNPNKYLQVNHIDCNKTNNHVSNLEWCTNKMNANHSIKNGRFSFLPKGEDHHSAKLTEKKVLKIREMFKDGYSRMMLAKEFKISHGTIKNVISRRTWKDI